MPVSNSFEIVDRVVIIVRGIKKIPDTIPFTNVPNTVVAPEAELYILLESVGLLVVKSANSGVGPATRKARVGIVIAVNIKTEKQSSIIFLFFKIFERNCCILYNFTSFRKFKPAKLLTPKIFTKK